MSDKLYRDVFSNRIVLKQVFKVELHFLPNKSKIGIMHWEMFGSKDRVIRAIEWMEENKRSGVTNIYHHNGSIIGAQKEASTAEGIGGKAYV